MAPARNLITEYFDTTGNGCGRHATAAACATELLATYVATSTGPLFDPRRDEPWWDPNVISIADLFSVGALVMPAFTTKRFTDAVLPFFTADAAASDRCDAPTCTEHVHCMLRRVPADASIFDEDAAVHHDTMNDLWTLLRGSGRGANRVGGIDALLETNQFGQAGLSKLLARKRPKLVPILDGVAVARVIRSAGPDACEWCTIRRECQSSINLRDRIATVRQHARAPHWMSDLRVIDVVVWATDVGGCASR